MKLKKLFDFHVACRQREEYLSKQVSDLKSQLTQMLSEIHQSRGVYDYQMMVYEKQIEELKRAIVAYNAPKRKVGRPRNTLPKKSESVAIKKR
jgi:hypothetical protein